jgi:hypothetical protein
MHGGEGVKNENFCEGLRGWCATGPRANKALCPFHFRALERVRGCFHQSWESGIEIRENERKILETILTIGSCDFTLSPSQSTKSAHAAKGYPARARCAPRPLTLALLWRGTPFNLIEQVIPELERGGAKQTAIMALELHEQLPGRSIQHHTRDLGAFTS